MSSINQTSLEEFEATMQKEILIKEVK